MDPVRNSFRIPPSKRLSFRLSLRLILLVSVTELAFTFLFLFWRMEDWRQNHERRVEETVARLQTSLPLDVWSKNNEGIQFLLNGELVSEGVRSLSVRAKNGEVLAGLVRVNEKERKKELEHRSNPELVGDYPLTLTFPGGDSRLVGYLLVEEDRAYLRDRLQQEIVARILSLVVLNIFLGIALTVALKRDVLAPLNRFAEVLGNAARFGEKPQFPELRYEDEFSRLRASFEAIVSRLESDMERVSLAERLSRERQLLAEETLEQLKSTQQALIESEKLSSLGALVAGIAHEVNTPLGVIVTGTSLASKDIQDIETMLQSGSVSRQRLADSLSNVRSAIELTLHNAQRASLLIGNFKQIAVDQTSESLREIELGAYVEDILHTLSPMLKKSRIEYRVRYEEPVSMSSYPGAIAQIISNLAANVVVHAYEQGEEGWCEFSVKKVGEKALIVCRDGGKGIPEENLGKVFDPFFTTKMGQGGSGLGLSIVYGLVVKKLRGRIRVSSSMAAGTEFEVEVPLRAGE